MFDPNKSLFELAVFKYVVWIILLFALISAIAILLLNEFRFCPEVECFNNLFSYYKLPLGILALLIPTIALLASNHRSEQTKAQIHESKSQNIFSNYYRHVEEFEDYVSSMINIENSHLHFDNVRELHSKLFPDSKNGSYDISKKLVDEIENFFITAKVNFEKFEDPYLSSNEWKNIVKNISDNCQEFHQLLHLRLIKHKGGTLRIDIDNQPVLTRNMVALVAHHTQLAVSINKLLSFDQSINKITKHELFTDLNLSVVPNLDFDKVDLTWVRFKLFE